MKKKAWQRIAAFTCALVLLLASAACQSGQQKPAGLSWDELAAEKLDYMESITTDTGVKLRYITFDDLAPKGYTLKESWDSMGLDDQGRVYIGWTSLRSDGKEDYVLFRYDNSTGERKFLGTFMQASEAVGNLEAGEQIPKGHTRLIYADGKMYMGSQGFHDFKEEIDDLPNMRGSHIYAYDIANDRLEDVSANLPGGVVTEHQGIVAMTYMPEEKLLVGLTHPLSDIVLFDITNNTVKKVVKGIPWTLGNPVSREIVATKYGKIYIYRGTEPPEQRNESHPMYEYDVASDTLTETKYEFTEGFWNGQTETADGETIYISTSNGRLYSMKTKDGSVEDLGPFLPKAVSDAGGKIDFFYSITLSKDEKRIYAIPSNSMSILFCYDIEKKEVETVTPFDDAIYTGGSVIDDKGYLYFGRFGGGGNWSYNCKLLIINLDGMKK